MARRQNYAVEVRHAAVELASSPYMFRGEREQIFRPRRGSTMEHIWKIGRLTYVQQRAWTLFIRMIMEAAGKSGPVTGSYSEKIDINNGTEGFNAPVAYENDALELFKFLMDRHLSRKERALLKDLLYDELTRPGVVGLGRVGFMLCGYKDDAQARAAGVGVVGYLMDRLDEFFKHYAHIERLERREKLEAGDRGVLVEKNEKRC